MVRCVRAALAFVTLAACVHAPPPKAKVVVFETAPTGGVLVTRTICLAADEQLCQAGTYQTSASAAPSLRFDQYIDPMLHLKLQLAGYALADAADLKLTPVDRTDTTYDGSATSSKLTPSLTVAELAPQDRIETARMLGLVGVLSSELHVVRRPHAPVRMELVVELIGLPDRRSQWRVTCNEPFESWAGTLRTLGDCAGNGIVAWRAPDAVIRRPR